MALWLRNILMPAGTNPTPGGRSRRWHRYALLAAIMAGGVGLHCTGDTPMKSTTIRRAAVAGSWYPADNAALTRALNGYFAAAPRVLTGVTVRALVAPHAGYAYSGRCAATAFKQLEGQSVARVFLLGPSHYMGFAGVASINVDAFETPLGLVPLDRAALDTLRQNPLVRDLPAAHAREHALELELPFLQLMLKEFTLVPLIVGQLAPSQARELGALLKQLVGPRDLIVVSTDFTHYGAAFGYAPFRADVKNRLTALDQGAITRVLAKDIDGIFAYADETGITWDGVVPTAIMLAALPADAHGTQLLYYKSGDADNEYSHSVSYAALAFSDAPPPAPAAAAPMPAAAPTNETGLTAAERATLLKIARATLAAHVQRKPLPDLATYPLTPRLKEKAGAFVTLHEHGDLRGCIGYIQGIKPLAETVRENACNAATDDPRFPPVKPDELRDITIEVSVMSPLRKVASPDEVVAGVHGCVLKKGWHQGVFLPQVATEQGWDRATFLRHLGLKAGLDMDAYKSAELFVFTADVFHEERGK
jgi:AmmeMemoRadiSam system protein B/AmmeMemoRadiSam system protein A